MSSNYVFYGINSMKQKKILEILNYAKEIRNSKYMINGHRSFVIDSFEARKSQDIYAVQGIIKCDNQERTFEAYIILDNEIKLYLDVKEDTKLLTRTSEKMDLTDDKVVVTTEYVFNNEVWTDEIIKNDDSYEQLGILVNA